MKTGFLSATVASIQMRLNLGHVKIKNVAIGIHILEALVMLCVNIRRGAALSVTVRVLALTLPAQVGDDDADSRRPNVGYLFQYVR